MTERVWITITMACILLVVAVFSVIDDGFDCDYDHDADDFADL